jgi:hypothetical protein
LDWCSGLVHHLDFFGRCQTGAERGNFTEQVCEAEPTAGLKQECTEQKHYAGMRPLGYFLGMLGAGVLYEVCDMAVGDAPDVASVGSTIALVISFILAINRLRNIAMGG